MFAMPFAIVSEEPTAALAVLSALPVQLDSRILTTAAFLAMLAEGGVFAALVDESVLTSGLASAIERAMHGDRLIAVVVMVGSARKRGLSAAFLADTARVGDDDLIHLWTSVRHEAIEWSIVRFVARAERRMGGSHRLVRALHAALHALRPFHTVDALAKHERCDARTLSAAWKNELVRVGAAVTLADVLKWIALLKGLETRVPNAGWEHTFKRFGWHRSRARAFAMKHVGCELGPAGDHEFARVIGTFHEQVVSAVRD